MDIPELDRLVQSFITQAYAENTNKAYLIHRKSYIKFCNLVNTTPVPAQPTTLALGRATTGPIPGSACVTVLNKPNVLTYFSAII